MRSLGVAAGLGFAALVAAATPAHAICAVNAPTRAPVVFVGVAAETERGFTRLAVEEVWKGPDLAPEVWVLSGQEAPPWPFSWWAATSSIDAVLEPGERYLVGASEDFATHACDVAAYPSSDLAQPPDEARSAVAAGRDGASPPSRLADVVPAASIVLGAGVLASLLVRRRRARAAQ